MNFLKELHKYTSSFSKDYTHVSLTPRQESFYIEQHNSDSFFNLYSDYITSPHADPIGIGEKVIGSSPVIADIDIKYINNNEDNPMEQDNMLYDLGDVYAVIYIFHSLFNRLFNNNLDDNYYTCILLEKEAYHSSKGEYKNGFHLHFPFMFLSKEDHQNHIIPFVKEHIDKYFEEKYENSIIAKYDDVLSTPWLLYGSRKDQTQDFYKVSGAFDKESIRDQTGIMPFHLFLSDIKIYDHTGVFIPLKDNSDLEYNLPRILSVVPNYREVLEVPIDPINSLRVIKMTENGFMPIEYSQEEYNDNRLKTIKLLEMISPEKAENHGTWMKVGWAIYNVCGSSKESLQLWIEFSKKCPTKFNLQECINKWEKMHAGGITIGTLIKFAREDSPDAYCRFTFEEQKRNIYASISGSNYDIAMLLYEEYKDIFRCSGGKRWWVFDNHIWSRTEDGVLLYNKISTELVSKFKNAKKEIKMDGQANIARNQLNPNYTDSDMKVDSKNLENRLSSIDKLIIQLKSTRFKSNVMTECAALFYDLTFETKLDTNGTIIAFNNGVYELDTYMFRPGLSTDYLSKKMPIDYEDFDSNDPKVHDVYRYLETIFPDSSLREYFITVSSTLFRGGNKDKKVYVWTGEKGDNGKSVLDNLFEQMLGPYSVKLPTSLITGKRSQSGSATPELARIGNGVRRVVLQEPGNTDEMNIGILKELSGNDKFYARDLFQKGSEIREIIPMFQPILICNKPPSADSDDNATWNRIRVVPFESTFVKPEDLPATYEEQLLQKKFLMDTRFSEKIPHIIKAFAWVLLQRYKENQGVVVFEPHKVKMATDKYRASNDLVANFIHQMIDKDVGQDFSICLHDIYKAFKCWFIELNGKKNIPSSQALEEKLVYLWGAAPSSVWRGYRFRQLQNGGGDQLI